MELEPFRNLMTSPTAACTGCVSILKDQQQVAIQHQTQTALAKPDAKPHQLCTVVENGRVVVRPIESSKVTD